MERDQKWLVPALEHLEAFYWAPGGPANKSHEALRTHGAGGWKDALALSYADYAFERAGAPRSWGSISSEIVRRYSDPDLAGLARSAWREFKSQVEKPNPKNNALAFGMAKKPATMFVRRLSSDNYNIIHWAARLSSQGSVSVAGSQLRALQGIGPKIAALFLRDVVTSHNIPESRLDDRREILPIDVWVRRGVSVLAGKPELTNETRNAQTTTFALAWADSQGLGLATLDTGLWVLGARFARSSERMAEALQHRKVFESLITEELARSERTVTALQQLRNAVFG